MIVLLDTSHDLEICQQELGCEVGQLLTPLTGFRLRNPDGPWAIDNGAFANFDAEAFLSRLRRCEAHREKALFVTAPDVVGSAYRTLEVFYEWFDKLSGWPIALAMQDGQQSLPVPWQLINAIFVGGSTQWKISHHAKACIKTAKALGKWVHVGRVNDPSRFAWCEELGVDSVDGSGIALYSHMRDAIRRRNDQQQLWKETA